VLLKFTKVLTIVFEIFWLVAIVSGFVRGVFPTNLVFWIAVVVEVFLGYLTYLTYKNSLVNNNARKWNLLGFALMVIAVAVPIILYYNVEYLKPVGSTWVFFLISLNTFYVYRIIKKQPISRYAVTPGRLLNASKVLYWVSLSGILAMVIVVIIIAIIGKTPVIGKEPVLELIFTLVCLPFLGFGYLVHRIVNAIWRGEKSEFFTYLIYSVRISVFVTVALIGLIAGNLDGLFFAALPLILLAGLSLALNYPNARRWEKWRAGTKAGSSSASPSP
jgi:hypothetical protein